MYNVCDKENAIGSACLRAHRAWAKIDPSLVAHQAVAAARSVRGYKMYYVCDKTNAVGTACLHALRLPAKVVY